MIRSDGAISSTQGFNQLTIVKGPGRIAMDHHNRLTAAFIDVMVPEAIYIHEMRLKRIKVPEATHDDRFSF